MRQKFLGGLMRRRIFITVLAGAAVSWPLGTLAQQGARIPRIGLLMPGHAEGPDASRVMINAIIEGLSDLGYTEGKNIIVERRLENRIQTDFAQLLPSWLNAKLM